MKKTLILLPVLLLLLLAACGRELPAEATSAPTETTSPAEVSPTPESEPDPAAPPVLTLVSGDGEVRALLDSAEWTYRNSEEKNVYTEQASLSQTRYFYEADWYSLGAPVLYAQGEARMAYDGPEPRAASLYAFNDMGMVPIGMVPIDMEDWTFTPYAGLNAYCLTAGWDREEERGKGSCRYIFFIEGAETNAPPAAETEELRLTVTRADGYGCAVTLEDLGTRPYNPMAMDDSGSPYALLRRTSAGGWEWIKPIRRYQGFDVPSLDKGESSTWAWDWSYSYGVLPAGDYALLLRGTLGRGTAKETVFLRGEFTITDAEPRGPGPLSFCPMRSEIENTLEQRSYHRWLQTLAPGETGWVAETDYSLFRVTHAGEKDEKWEYIPPEYHLPEMQNHAIWILYGRSRAYDVDLAAQYGELPAGTYVLRRRFLRLTEEELEEAAFSDYRNWRLAPEDRVVYGDTWLNLPYGLWDVPRGVDPIDERVPPYNGEASPLLVSTAGSSFTSTQATVRLENLYTDPGHTVNVEADYYYLYFSHRGEWYPVEHRRVGVHGLIGDSLAAGETKKLNFRFDVWYGELSAGTYRMVISCYSEPLGDDAGFILCQFRINEDGSGEWLGADEAEHLVNLYARERLSFYDLSLEGNWFYRPGPLWLMDPYVQSWKLERQRDKLTVKVWREGDYAMAEALLGNNTDVEIILGEVPYAKPSPVREEKICTEGVLTARLLEQEDTRLDPECTWILSLTWNGAETVELYPGAFWCPYVEEYDPQEEVWRRLPMTLDPGVQLAVGWSSTVPLEPGKTVNVYLATMAWYKAELSRDKEYRFVMYVEGLGIFLCPFRLGQYEKAASEEEIAALAEDYPLMDDYIYNETNFLGKSLEKYFDVTMGYYGGENYVCFYAEAEYLGKGPSSEDDRHKALRFRIPDIICGNVGLVSGKADTLPEGYVDEDGGVVVCYNSDNENWGDTRTLPEFREGERYILCLTLLKEGDKGLEEYPNALYLLGDGEVYYVTEGDLIMPTQHFRQEYAGYSRLTFRRLLRELYEETNG